MATKSHLEAIAVIDISPETQNLIDEIVASGRFSNREEVVDLAVRLLNVDLEHDRNISKLSESSAQQWCEELEAWATNHPPLPQEADDSRESIYEGRGE